METTPFAHDSWNELASLGTIQSKRVPKSEE